MPIGQQENTAEGTFLYANRYSIGAAGDHKLEMKVAGITMDWSTVTAVSGSAVTLKDGTVIPIGAKYLRYGTPVYRHTDGTYRVATDAAPATAKERASDFSANVFFIFLSKRNVYKLNSHTL